MPIVRLSWNCDKEIKPFSVYKSLTNFDLNNLPIPFATNVTNTYHTFATDSKELTYYLIANDSYQSEVYEHDPFKS